MWSKNLPSAVKKLKQQCDIGLMDKGLVDFVKLPLKKDTILFLYEDMKE